MKQLLDLNTLVDRPKVRIVSETHPDGRFYEMRTRDELSIVQHQRVAARYRWVTGELSSDDPAEMTEAEARRLTEALDDMLRIVLIDLEDEVLAALTDGQKGQVVNAYMDEFYPNAADSTENGQDPT